MFPSRRVVIIRSPRSQLTCKAIRRTNPLVPQPSYSTPVDIADSSPSRLPLSSVASIGRSTAKYPVEGRRDRAVLARRARFRLGHNGGISTVLHTWKEERYQ